MKWINTQIEWLKSFLSEPINGSGKVEKGSTKRIATLVVTFTFAYTYIATSFELHTMPDIPYEWVGLILIVLGVPGVIDYFKGKGGIEVRKEDRKDKIVDEAIK